jgi:RNA polymerase sigma-70 factor (ECF subfamily)
MGDSAADQELVARVQGGDKRAFDLLVAKYQQRIVKLVSRYVKDHSDALDVAQEVFLKTYRALPKFRGDSAFYTWMYRIAINTAKNYLVMMSRRPTEVDLGSSDDGVDIENLRSDVDTPEHMLLTEEIKMTVAEAIEALPDDLKTAITLRELEGFTYEEIAQAMSCPIGTVRSRIFRAREAIDKRLRPLLN